jgi:hypothetical protein
MALGGKHNVVKLLDIVRYTIIYLDKEKYIA